MSTDPPIPAPLWRRLAASLYDLLPVAALSMAAAAAWIAIAMALAQGSQVAAESYGRWAIGNWPFRLWLLAALFGYYGLSWRRGGQTLGMRAWRIAVRTHGAATPAWPAVAIRFGVALLGVAVAGLGLWWSLADPRRRMWHDLAAGTEVIVLPHRRPDSSPS